MDRHQIVSIPVQVSIMPDWQGYGGYSVVVNSVYHANFSALQNAVTYCNEKLGCNFSV